jgi:hypothetical protein
MSDEKDRWGQKLHDVEKVREDQWAREEDQKLIDKLRHRQPAEMHCPQCNGKLVARVDANFAMMSCPNDHGAWLDKVALEQVIRSKK